jgi:hypothetical protein
VEIEQSVAKGPEFEAILKQGSVTLAAKWLNQNGYRFQSLLRSRGFRPRHGHFTFDSLYKLLSNPS